MMMDYLIPLLSLLAAGLVCFFAGWFWSDHLKFIREHRQLMKRLDALEAKRGA